MPESSTAEKNVKPSLNEQQLEKSESLSDSDCAPTVEKNVEPSLNEQQFEKSAFDSAPKDIA